jgi:hypothetical protein
MKKAFLLLLVSFLMINCKQKSEPNILGNWYYISENVDDLLEIKPTIDVYISSKKIYSIEDTFYPENRNYIISNDSIYLVTPKKKTFNGLITNLTENSFIIINQINEKVHFYKIKDHLTIEDFINKDCTINEYYDSYHERIKSLKNK